MIILTRSPTRSGIATCLALVAALPACVRAGWETSARDGAPRDAPVLAELRWPFDGGVSCETSTANVPASCTCEVADFNDDGRVDVRDLAILSGCFLKPPDGACAITDTNGDGWIDCQDLECLAKHFLGGCPGWDAGPAG